MSASLEQPPVSRFDFSQKRFDNDFAMFTTELILGNFIIVYISTF